MEVAMKYIKTHDAHIHISRWRRRRRWLQQSAISDKASLIVSEIGYWMMTGIIKQFLFGTRCYSPLPSPPPLQDDNRLFQIKVEKRTVFSHSYVNAVVWPINSHGPKLRCKNIFFFVFPIHRWWWKNDPLMNHGNRNCCRRQLEAAIPNVVALIFVLVFFFIVSLKRKIDT